jgi:membrane-associated protease RseP (regulator of RpoE activity)
MTDIQQEDQEEPAQPGQRAQPGQPGQPGRSWIDRVTEGVAGGYSAPPAGDPGPSGDGSSQRQSLVTLVVVVVGVVLVAAVGHDLVLLAIIAVLAGVILLHEAGHFTAAKLSGMKVTEFFLGFGPRLWSVRKGETEYGVKAIPAGGYCRIVGMNNLEEVDPADEDRSYREASFGRRFAVGVAGSTVHFILALITIWTLFAFSRSAKVIPGVEALVPAKTATPAQIAGFQPGDRILSYDGHEATSWDAMHTYIQKDIGVPITFVVERGGHSLTLTATPADESTVRDTDGVPFATTHVGFLGVTPLGANYSLLGSIPHAARTFWDSGVIGTFQALGAIFSPHGISSITHQVTSKPGSTPAADATNRPVSIIGIVSIAKQESGWANKAFLFFEVNAFVGVLNLLPMLPFDGGHVAIALYEAVRSRRGRRYQADVTKMLPYAMALMVLLAFVFVSTTYLDIAHPISLH